MGLSPAAPAVLRSSPPKRLDERTGMTVGSLKPSPIELVQGAPRSSPRPASASSFAYLGPVEWDNMGTICATGSGFIWRPATIGTSTTSASAGAVTLTLDDGAVRRCRSSMRRDSAHGPYQPVASWGQTAYFDLDVGLLKRMAASAKHRARFQRAAIAAVRFIGVPLNARDVARRNILHVARLLTIDGSTTRGSVMVVPGRMSLKSTSGLYCATSQTGRSPCCCAIVHSDSPRFTRSFRVPAIR